MPLTKEFKMNMKEKHNSRKLPAHCSLSVIVPAFDEVDNMEPLAKEFEDFLSGQKFRAEVIVVDDGSTDGTAEKVLELAEQYKFLKLVRHKQNLGKTAAIESGFAVSEGKRICIFDADLQYDPRDIKPMMDKLDRGYGIVAGIKKGRYQKAIVSKIYNWMTRRLFGLRVKDMNSLKLLRRDVMANLFLRKDWHRFMVVLAAERGYKIAEMPVTLRPRKYGEPKYGGIGRLFVGMTDLTAVWIAEKVLRKPMLIFGSFGFVLLGLAVLLGIFILVMRIGFDWGYPPLQTILLLLVLLGGFALTLGFLAEAVANLRDRVEFLMSKIGAREMPKIETARTAKPDRHRQKPRRPERNREKREPKGKSRTQGSESPRPTKTNGKSAEKQARPPRRKPPPRERTKKTEPEPIEETAQPEETKPSSNKSSIEILPPTNEVSWGRRDRKTKPTSVHSADDKEAFKRVEEMAKKIDSEASLGFTGTEPEKENE